jgi:protein-tyrosine-phosphatase
MRQTSRRWAALAVAVALAGPVAGCVAAAAAGAAGAIYATSRGSEAVVQGSVDDVTRRARAVMADLGIAPEGEQTHTAGDKHELKGKQGDLDVTIAMERSDAETTKVEVYARKNLAEWDKDYSKEVLERIVKKG